MKKMIMSLLALSLLWTACDTEPKQAQDADTPVMVSLDSFESKAADLVDQLVIVKGTCLHTCKHGGGKMFLSTGDSAAYSLKVIASEESGNFNAGMEGSDFEVVGIVDEYRIDATEIDRMESEINGDVAEEGEKDPAACTGHAEDEAHQHDGEEVQAAAEEQKAAQLEQVANLRQKLEDSGKAYLSFFSLKAKSYKAIEE